MRQLVVLVSSPVQRTLRQTSQIQEPILREVHSTYAAEELPAEEFRGTWIVSLPVPTATQAESFGRLWHNSFHYCELLVSR